jgi:hypothetical protein
MTIKTIQATLLAVVFGLAVQAQAAMTFDITFTGTGTGEGNIGNGVYTAGNGVVTATANGGGTYTVTDGTFDVTAGPGFLGNYSLVSNPNAPGGTTTLNVPGGYFIYDDQLTYPGTPYVTDVNGNNGGLLFYNNSSATYLQIDYVGPYETWTVWNSGYTYAEAQGTMTVTPVPEPTAIAAAALLLLLPLGASASRILRKKQAV